MLFENIGTIFRLNIAFLATLTKKKKIDDIDTKCQCTKHFFVCQWEAFLLFAK
jgi:hypothetical protein